MLFRARPNGIGFVHQLRVTLREEDFVLNVRLHFINRNRIPQIHFLGIGMQTIRRCHQCNKTLDCAIDAARFAQLLGQPFLCSES